MATIQNRLTSDNKQHDEAFEKSKQQVYNYSKQVENSSKGVKKFGKQVEGAKGNVQKFGNDISGLLGKVSKLNPAVGSLVSAFSRFAPGIGLATGAIAILKKTIQSTQFSGDALTITLEKAKASVNLFTSSLAMGNFDNFIENLKSIRKEAEEAAKAFDNFTTKTLTNKAAYAKYSAERSKLERIIKDPKSTPEQIKKAQDELDELPKKMEAAFQQEANLAKDTFVRAFDVIAEGKGKETIKNRVAEIFKNSTPFTAFDNVAKFYEKIILENGMLFDKLSDEEQKNVVDLYLEWQKLIQLPNELYSNNSKLLNKSTESTTSKSTKKSNNDKIGWISNRKYIESIFNSFSQVEPVLDEFGDTVYEKMEMPLERVGTSLNDVLEKSKQYAHESIEIIESEAEHAERLANIFDLQLNTINSLSSAFNILGNEFNSTGLKAAGIIGEAIANIIKGYSEASAKQAAGSITGWDWLAFSAAGLAQVASVIAQIHSLSGYAGGGIIGGNSYTGDKVLARVNSGEMILNPSQQANLFNMINGGVSTGGEVKFRIEGSTLVGVLNNYNKKVRRVM